MVEDARLDLEIALKFEPKNKFVIKELRKLEQDYGRKREEAQRLIHHEKGKEVFDPLNVKTKGIRSTGCTYKAAVIENLEGCSYDQDEGMDDVLMDACEPSTPVIGTKDSSPAQGESSNNMEIYTGESKNEGGKLQEYLKEPVTNKAATISNQPISPCDMDIDKKSISSTLSEESSGENSIMMVGIGLIAEGRLNPSQTSGDFTEKDMITFSNARKPNCYIRISRKAYQEMVVGRQLSYNLASRHECLSVRVLDTTGKQDSPRVLSNDKESKTAQEVGMDDTSSTITSEYASNNHSISKCEAEDVFEVGSCNMESEDKDGVVDPSESSFQNTPTPFFFKASTKRRGRKNEMKQSCFRYFRTHGRCNTKSVPLPPQGKGYSKFFKPKFVCLCRNEEKGDKERKRKIDNRDFEEGMSNKKRITFLNLSQVESYKIAATDNEDSSTESFTLCNMIVSSVSPRVQGGP